MDKQEIQKMLQHAEQEEVYSFILEYAGSNKAFSRQLKEALVPKVEDLDIEVYRAKAENCFDFEGGGRGRRRYQYDFYQAAYDAASGLDDMLANADYFIEQEEYASAAAIAMSVAEVIPRNYENVDDSSGSLGGTFNMATDCIITILENEQVSKSLKEEIYDWVKRETNDSIYSDYGFDSIIDVYDVACQECGKPDEVLSDFDKKIGEANEYKKESLILRKIRFMQARNIDTQDFIQKYIGIERVRRVWFDQLMKIKFYDKALSIAKEGLEIAKNEKYSRTQELWTESIFEVYLLQGKVDNILFYAEKLLLLSYSDGNRYYQIIKEYSNSVDLEKRMERIRSSFENSHEFKPFAAKLFVEQEMWERLFKYCKKGYHIVNTIKEYEHYLKPYFGKEILDIYHKYVEEEALISNYSAYMRVADILKRMRSFEGGNALVEQLLQEYRSTYKRRKNMVAALKDV